MYLNSTATATSINSSFYVPGLFSRLIVELNVVNRTCIIQYSRNESPYYHCLFKNLPSAQWFILTYYLAADEDQTAAGDATIVHTGKLVFL